MRPPVGHLDSLCASSLREELRGKRMHFGLKRALDIVLSLMALVVMAPMLAAIAVCIHFSSPGPVLFRQRRIGYETQEFWFYKFRSMRVNSSGERQTSDLERAGVLYKCENDPRVTPIGRFIRRWSIDELPQIFNVLKGDMSLVGPRPLVPFMLQPYPDFKEIRSLVRPGLTGLWQIRDRAHNTSAEVMMPHDLEYISQFTFWRDLKILWRTLFAVASGRGAV